MKYPARFAAMGLVVLVLALSSGPVATAHVAPPDPPTAASSVAAPSPSPAAAPPPLVWAVEAVDRAKLFRNMEDRSLALDAAGHPHVAYGDDNLFYAWHDGTSWHYEVVDVGVDVGEYAALRLDAQGGAHISYYDRYYGSLRYAYRPSNGTWRAEVVDTGVGSG